MTESTACYLARAEDVWLVELTPLLIATRSLARWALDISNDLFTALAARALLRSPSPRHALGCADALVSAADAPRIFRCKSQIEMDSLRWKCCDEVARATDGERASVRCVYGLKGFLPFPFSPSCLTRPAGPCDMCPA